MSAPELLTTPELALALKTSERTARRFMREHGVQLSPRVWRMPLVRLEEVLESAGNGTGKEQAPDSDAEPGA